ncbi:very short patch repair endonuclease [Achromobacter sp. NPDC058515]|uniref:very short patch repair endonuclease n=1 Tax=Achromobacter sp. NPDC058515 TaxID=3346533 RepID=UPI003648C64E
MDNVSPKRRSEIMRQVRSKNTSAELVVRRIVHGLGYRYRLHQKDLPGKPDLVFAGRRKVIFVHGCFWHAHENCSRARIPGCNRPYWEAKIGRNVSRDSAQLSALLQEGWEVMVVWECELRDGAMLEVKLREFLDG